MRMTICVVAMIIPFSICSPVLAQDRTAYMLRYEDGSSTEIELVKVDIPSEYPPDYPVEPTVVGLLGLESVSSMAMSPSGELLALDYDGDRLVEIDMATGAASPYVDLDLDISPTSGIAFDQAGQVWLMNWADYGYFLFHLNPQTGETSLVVQLVYSVSTIAVHNGTMYAGHQNQLVEVDTTTGMFTELIDWGPSDHGCHLTALHSDNSDLWGVLTCWIQVVCSGTGLVRFFPEEPVVGIATDGPINCDGIPFALVVVTQAPTPIPAITLPGVVVLAFLLGGAGYLTVRSRLSG